MKGGGGKWRISELLSAKCYRGFFSFQEVINCWPPHGQVGRILIGGLPLRGKVATSIRSRNCIPWKRSNLVQPASLQTFS